MENAAIRSQFRHKSNRMFSLFEGNRTQCVSLRQPRRRLVAAK